VTGRYGTIGEVFYVEQDFWPLNTTLWVKDFKGNNPKFASFLLRTIDFSSCSDKSSVPGVNRNDLHLILVDLPPLGQQRAIADVLSAFDDKIELNRRMSQTLESMARAIFRSWFVDFDPVVAKAAGRQPFGMSADVAALFPDRFVDSGIGPIPYGWQLGRLDDVVVLQRGYDLPASGRTPGIYPVLSAGGPTGTHCEFKVRGPGVTTGRSGQLGAVYFVHEHFWPLNTSLYVKEFRASSPLHAYFLLQTLDFDSFNAGSAVPTLNRNHVHNLPVVVPPEKLLALFNGFAGPLFDLSRNNGAESRALAALRETLLPKLMSGELRVRDAEKLVGTHV
jgi:type I restriction enzyme S subunit